MKLKFYTYDQNNSGGSFVFDDKAGISTKVIIQARDCKEANFRAENIGLYFGGDGDCGCCGDRWGEQFLSWDGDDPGTDIPTIYGGRTTIEEWITDEYFTKWQAPDRPEVYVHLYDDTFTGYVYGSRRKIRMHLEES